MLRRIQGKHKADTKAQVIIEFTACMIIILLMLYGITKVLTWTGREYAGRFQGHDETLYKDFVPGYISTGDGPMQQIDPYFYTPVKMNAIYRR